MEETLFKIILALIPVIGAVFTGVAVPFIKTRISAGRFDEIVRWIGKAVEAAEVLFNTPGSGDKKREYVIRFVDKMFNAKKVIITEEQIRVLLEAAWKEMT